MNKRGPFQVTTSGARRMANGKRPMGRATSRLEKRTIECVPEGEVEMEIEKMKKKGWEFKNKGRHYGKYTIKFTRKV